MCYNSSKHLTGKLSRRLKQGGTTSSPNCRPSRLGRQPLKTVLAFSPVCLLGCGAVVGLGLASSVLGANAFAATSVSGAVQLNAEVATAIAMKIASPNDTDPDCLPQTDGSGNPVTYGVANRYATSNGAEGSKQVDTFDGTTGGADEINDNTSCATLTMTPNTFSSTYSDVTVYTNSPNGYAVSLRSADSVSPNLVNTTDNTQYIPAGTLTETSGGVVSGGQNAWSYKTNNGIITNWTPVSASDATIKSYDQETLGGSTTRVTYGISAGNNPTGTYATTLTYTATMFDGSNPYVSKLNITTDENITASTANLSIPFGESATVTVTPAEGYYLSSVTCPTGFTCTGYNTGIDYTEPQTVTVANNNTNATGTLSFAATEATPICNSSLPVGAECYNSATDQTLMVKLSDGHFWTKNDVGMTTWYNAGSKCSAGTSIPSVSAFNAVSDADKALVNWTSGIAYWTSTSATDSLAYVWAELGTGCTGVVGYNQNCYKSQTIRAVCYK